MPDPEQRDIYLANQMDELEAMLRADLQRMDAYGGSHADQQKVLREFKALWKEMKERDMRVNKRVSTMTGVMIGALASTTVAAVAALLNLVGG